jgi:hypothetical protein
MTGEIIESFIEFPHTITHCLPPYSFSHPLQRSTRLALTLIRGTHTQCLDTSSLFFNSSSILCVMCVG